MSPRRALLSVIAFGLVVSPALAFPTYRQAVIAQLKLEPDKTDGTRAITCQYCHVNTDGGDPWNSFGQLVQTNLKGDINEAIFAALSAMRDSDKDGFEDALEVFAKTLPGDAKSVPTEKHDELKARFEKAGGLVQYKPK